MLPSVLADNSVALSDYVETTFPSQPSVRIRLAWFNTGALFHEP